MQYSRFFSKYTTFTQKAFMRFSKLFKLSSARLSIAFTQAQRVGSIPGIKLMHVAQSTENRFVIALTKQINGSVKRNKVRRRIKAALTLILKHHKTLPGGIWLCVAYEAAPQITMNTFYCFLKAHLCQASTSTH